MKFSEIKDYVLTPGAELYVKLLSAGFCDSPAEMVESIVASGGLESSVVEDFVYARIPLSKELAYSIDNAFSIIRAADVWEYWNNYEQKKDSGCLVVGIEFLLDDSVVIDAEDVAECEKEAVKFKAEWKEQLSKIKELRKVLKSAQQLIRGLDCLSDGYYEQMDKLGTVIDDRVKLLRILALQNERKQTKDDLENTDGIWSKVCSIPYFDRKTLMWDVCSELTYCWKLAMSLESVIEESFWGDCYYSEPIDVRLRELYKSAVSGRLSSSEFDPESFEFVPTTHFGS